MYGISVDGDAAGVEVKRRECEDNGSIEKKNGSRGEYRIRQNEKSKEQKEWKSVLLAEKF